MFIYRRVPHLVPAMYLSSANRHHKPLEEWSRFDRIYEDDRAIEFIHKDLT